MTYWLGIPFLILLVFLAFLTMRVKGLFSAVVAFGAYGFVISLEWALMGAVDVAFTEIVIGAGAWTVFMLAMLRRTGEEELMANRKRRRTSGMIAVVGLAAMLVLSVVRMPAWGDPTAPAATHVSPRYIEGAVAETATPNMVTAVLGDYRSLDTMFEVTVVFAAALALVLVLGFRRREGDS